MNDPATLGEALSLRRNARIGLTVGVGLAALLYVPRLPALDVAVTGSAGFYLGLALVLAATTAAVVTAGLSAKVMLEPVLDRAAWLRRGGTAAVAGGLVWAALPGLAWLAGRDVVSTALWRAATGLAALALVVGTVGLHAAVRGGVGPTREAGGDSSSAGVQRGGTRTDDAGTARRVERVAYWVVVLALLLAAGNASGSAAPVAATEAGPLATPFLTAAFLAFVAAVPFAAAAELCGGGRSRPLGVRPLRALHVGALLGTLGIAWLVAAGGWTWLGGVGPLGGPGGAGVAAAGLAVATVPTGLGWVVAGLSLRSVATRQADRGNSSR